MKPKNIVLLGFVNKAVKYLDQHIDEDKQDYKLSKLKNIDLVSIEDELSKNLEDSLGTMQSTMTTLLHAGNEAFDAFLDNHDDTNELIGELNDIFNVDFDDKKTEKEELEDLLSFYNLDDTLYSDEDEPEDIDVDESEFVDETLEESDNQNIIEEEIEKNNANVNSDEDSIVEEDVYDEPEIINNELVEDNLIDDVIDEKDIVNDEIIDEDNIVDDEPIEDDFLKEIEKAASEMELDGLQEEFDETNDEIDSLFSEIINHENNPVEEEIEDDIPETEEVEKQDILDDDVPVDEHISTPEIDLEKELETVSNYVPEALEDNIEEKIEEEPKQEYVSSLIEELKKQMEEDEIQKQKEEEERQLIYEQVHELFPFISSSFVKSVYDIKEDINKDYPEGLEGILLHRLVFKDVDELRQFAEIVMDHGFNINVDEKQLIVDCMKPFVNKKGTIVSNIFEVANQAAKLHGAYDGYRVITDII